jgi:HK97 gp10 family phage protein
MIDLVGDKELIRKFTALPVKLQKKHGRRAISKAARRLVKAAKAKCPKRSGQLKKSLGFKPRTYKTGVFAIVGPRSGFRTMVDGRPHDPKKIAHLVELGHAGPHAAQAKPFLRPAFDETVANNITLIGDELRHGLAEEAMKV